MAIIIKIFLKITSHCFVEYALFPLLLFQKIRELLKIIYKLKSRKLTYSLCNLAQIF